MYPHKYKQRQRHKQTPVQTYARLCVHFCLCLWLCVCVLEFVGICACVCVWFRGYVRVFLCGLVGVCCTNVCITGRETPQPWASSQPFFSIIKLFKLFHKTLLVSLSLHPLFLYPACSTRPPLSCYRSIPSYLL